MNLLIFHYGYAPWNEFFLARKLQIKDKVSSGDLKRNWGIQHFSDLKELDADFQKKRKISQDLNSHMFASQALKRWC
jgi:hypothetical protein